MCYSISKDVTENKLIARYNKGLKIKDFTPKQLYINGFGYPELPIIKQEERQHISSSQWGFVPSFIKTERDAKEFRMKYLTLNAKSETVFSLKSFKDSILPRRCLIPVTGFFEHRHINTKDKIPYYIHLKNEPIFSLGGIYDYWTNEMGEQKCSFSILTTEANTLMEKIHNSKKRMPLIIPKDFEEIWLDPALKEGEIKELMYPLKPEFMTANTIAKINPRNVNVFDEKIIEEVNYPELALIDSI